MKQKKFYAASRKADGVGMERCSVSCSRAETSLYLLMRVMDMSSPKFFWIRRNLTCK
jgi:hypothetical protein